MEILSAEKENDSAFAHLRSTYNIETIAEEAQVEASAELVAGLREMLNNPDFSDVVFLCNDGKQVSASRMHLASRSDVLKSLLRNGMIESSLAEIKLPEVSSSVMLSVLEFLYTGTVDVYGPQSWKMGWEVIIASQFFLLPKLEIIVRKFMHAQMVSVAYDLPGAAVLLTEALGFKAIREQGQEILKELITILSSNWSDSVFVQNLSEDVFHYFLVNTSCNFDIRILIDDILSFREYLRFRQVIHWWVCRSDLGSHPKEELMRILVPDKEEVMSICARSPEVLEAAVESPKEVLVRELRSKILHSDEALGCAAMRLVTNIDYRLIHPAVLAKVVEPLKISSGEIVNAFRFHALRSFKAIKLPVNKWDIKCHSYSTSEHGHVIYRTSSTIGLAVVSELITSEHRVYKWELVIEEDCSEFAELGFVHVLDSELAFEKALSSQKIAWVLKFNGKETRVSDGSPRRDSWKELQVQHWRKGSKVSFNMDTSKGTCSLSINGQDFGVVWKRLNSRGICYFPAMSFGACRRGRIRVKLGEGFMSE